MSKHQLSKSVKARMLDASGQPKNQHEYPIPSGSIVDDLFEERGTIHFKWKGEDYALPAGQLGRPQMGWPTRRHMRWRVSSPVFDGDLLFKTQFGTEGRKEREAGQTIAIQLVKQSSSLRRP